MTKISSKSSEKELQQTLRNHLETWAKENLPEFDELSLDTSPETLEEITKSLEKLAETEFDSITKDATGEFIDAIETTFQEWAKIAREELKSDGVINHIYQTVTDFFKAEEWPFLEEEDESILYMNFKGENGEWSCLAKVKEEENQFIFYSLYPEAVPEEKRQGIAEFITRANYGTILGNFELDFDDGEIRYKTSIDVEGDSLNFALIKQMVYANVMMMDEYLPGIQAILSEKLSPLEAITQIEGS
ncbi:MAG: YbjN domain-containing protein [Okeania sp. SIO2G4]|uniref:YbjN domain-containing protein n=1 Tax=unclassified Okeania TaxID=2634635 RepID=UPI0013B7F07D|nr:MULTISPECIES: YbjN domain-containing protein [unclassified Okeania]NEP05046.1 YbjN domain-containing protein [Okeania sp. SIO4D6]NEP38864.1 YbjN domain-containing protein [Okeania sp. SIO2H7]NEP73682.1 YbjN domain-containing protein [Okeania sp. SIO2G5]NEP94499.1 YbjN domain-containing protein [Okeania sp. SIO2F5]NEQ92105.1 YbjN domain-containing protein [Okeania sp. SIO2G4]